MSEAAQYGDKKYCVRFGKDGPPKMIFADRMEVTDCGALIALGGFRAEGQEREKATVMYAWPAGKWTECYAASLLDGRAVAED